MISTDDLYRLITAIDLGDAKGYHGDIRDGLLDCLHELREMRETVESVEAESIEALADAFEKLQEVKRVIAGEDSDE